MKKTLEFGKIAYNSSRKINLVTVDVELNQKTCINYETGIKELMHVFMASAEVWDSKRTDWVTGGQCLDDLLSYLKDNRLYKRIVEIWNDYHLNDITTGTLEQMNLLKEFKEGKDYKAECNFLENKGKLISDLGGDPYEYGSKWLCKPIPDSIVKEIKSIMETID